MYLKTEINNELIMILGVKDNFLILDGQWHEICLVLAEDASEEVATRFLQLWCPFYVERYSTAFLAYNSQKIFYRLTPFIQPAIIF